MSQTRIKVKKNKKAGGGSRRGTRYWMAVGTVAAYATFSGDAVFKVYAQQDRPARNWRTMSPLVCRGS